MFKQKKLNLIATLLLLAVLLAGCGATATTTSTLAPTARTAATTAAPKGGLDDSVLEVIEEATKSGDFSMPLDAIPNNDFTTIYFTASNANGTGVFKVPAKGGAAVALATGKPFEKARGISLSPDGKQIFVADTAANGGQIFTLSPDGGQPTPLAGTNGTSPQNLTVAEQGSQVYVYFSGKDPASNQPALLKIAAMGATTPTVVAKGMPLVEPDGVVVAQNGTVYVADRAAAGNGFGKVFKIEGDKPTPVIEKVRTGNPAGITLTTDDNLLLVSALNPDKGTDQVFMLNLKTGDTGVLTKVVGQNSQGGGLHATPSRKENKFAWSDINVGGRGKVYGLSQFK